MDLHGNSANQNQGFTEKTIGIMRFGIVTDRKKDS
jgi:hypothetical protein